jgi:hypothetical protein
MCGIKSIKVVQKEGEKRHCRCGEWKHEEFVEARRSGEGRNNQRVRER